MKLSKIAKLCVRAKRVYLYDDTERGIQWVGDGRSMYPLYMMPELTTETVLRVLDVKDKDFDKIAVSKADLPSHIDCSDGTDDKLLDQLETLARELRQMMQTDETDTDTHRALPWAADENGEVI